MSTQEQAEFITRLAEQAAPAVLAEAHAEGFDGMTIGGAHRLAYVAFAHLLGTPPAESRKEPS